METTLSSKSKTVVISPERPFVIIGERINPTGRKKLAEEMAAGDFSRVRADALAQVAAGAHVLDVNAGVPVGDEPSIMRKAVETIMEVVDVPLCFDSASPVVLEAGLSMYGGKALINSTTAEDAALERVMPLAKKYGSAVICLCNDEAGPVKDPQVRLQAARKIIARAADFGIPLSDLIFDPLVMGVGTDSEAPGVTLATLRLLRQELGVNFTGGASNVSFGLPDRPSINAAFMAMAIAEGLNSAITNPLEPAVATSILAANLVMGHDVYGAKWIKAFRTREKAKLAQ
ncbi:MAG: dihydropteroate synthase [Anaerolineaceae bacterium]|nr:dihydropteroate synthase [Anaerolineaceae bacterium]